MGPRRRRSDNTLLALAKVIAMVVIILYCYITKVRDVDFALLRSLF